MLHFLSSDEVKDYQLFIPIFNSGTGEFEFTGRAIKDIGTPLGDAHLDLKRHFRMKQLIYRLKWKRQITGFGFSTGVSDTIIDTPNFECINMSFRNSVGRDAAALVNVGSINLIADSAALQRALMKVNTLMGRHTFLLTDTSVLKPLWPLAYSDTVSDFDQVDVRNLAGNGGLVGVIRGGEFAGVNSGPSSGPHGTGFIIEPDAFAGDDGFVGGGMNTDLSTESSDPATYNSGNSFHDTNGSGSLTVYYREFWQIVFGP